MQVMKISKFQKNLLGGPSERTLFLGTHLHYSHLKYHKIPGGSSENLKEGVEIHKFQVWEHSGVDHLYSQEFTHFCESQAYIFTSTRSHNGGLMFYLNSVALSRMSKNFTIRQEMVKENKFLPVSSDTFPAKFNQFSIIFQEKVVL